MPKIIILIALLFIGYINNAQEANFSVFKNKTIILKNNITLAHDLYLVKNKEKAPSILIRTPYGKDGIAQFASHFANNGFNVIVQDVRGKNASKGVFVPFINEKSDGLETVDWITKQPWFNGSIGLWGSSYLGYSALMLSDTERPTIKSAFNLSGWIDGTEVNYPGGAFHQMLIIPWLLSDGQSSKLSEQGADLDEMYAHTPLKEAIPGEGTFISELGTAISIDDLSSHFDYSKVKIPIFHMTGWYDFTNSATIDALQNISKASSANQYALLGPWYHNQVYDEHNFIGEYELPRHELVTVKEFLELATNWFKHTLNSEPFEFGDKNIKYYVLFADEWKYASIWPPKTTTKTLFLHNGKLLEEKSNDKMNLSTFSYDPKEPVITAGGANFNLFTDYIGINNQNTVESRDDVLLFTSNAFENDAVVAGNIKVSLYISTEGKSTDFTAKITLVNQKGQSLNITDNIIRLKPEELNEKVTKIIIQLPDTAFEVKKGEKIRLQISSSNYPKFNRNPNTGEDPLEAVKFIPVQQTIYHSKKYPSKITIPILKN